MASKLQDSCLFQRSWLCVKSQRQHLLEASLWLPADVDIVNFFKPNCH